MWRLLARLRVLVRPRFAPVPDAVGLDAEPLRALRELYVSGALPVKDYEWRVRHLARTTRAALAGDRLRLRPEPSPAARAGRRALAPLALVALVAPLAWSQLGAGERITGVADAVRALAAIEEPVAVGATATPFARVMPGQDGVVAVDYFDHPETGLMPRTSSDPAKYARGYLDGGYLLRVVDPAWHFVAKARPLGTYDDVGVAVDATLLGDVTYRYVAVACRDGDTPQSGSYRLSVEPARGVYSLSRWDDTRQLPLESLQPSPAIRRGHGTNRIGLSCVGSQITAVVNGVSLKTVTDSVYSRGAVWLGVGAYANRNLTADARFHNLVISEH